ncbi:MAG TPA: thioesterase family protein [Flavisolibacter sp.]|nr:thioesterase family protein [Flavisolibacter sp.]
MDEWILWCVRVFRLARKEKSYFPTAAISVQFVRPLKLFQKAILTTRVIHITPTDIYLEQKVMSGEKKIAACLVKSTVKKGRETLDVPAIVRRLGTTPVPTGAFDMIAAFENQNSLMKEYL